MSKEKAHSLGKTHSFEKKYYLCKKYPYIDTIAYDLFGQRSYIRYGNGAETRYSYSSNRQRLSNLTVNANNVKVMDNTYKYDVMDNIVGLIGQGKPQTLQDGKSIGGAITHTYSYDEWDRLIGAKGTFNGGSSKIATYDLRMEYDKLYNVTSKQLDLKQNNLQFAGSLKTGYTLNYNYKEDDLFRLESIDTKQYSKDGDGEADTIKRVNSYTFDDNGNLTLQLTDTERDSSHCADTMGTKVKNHLWDEENRLLAINDNGFVSNYFYDASGERTVKLSKPDLFVYVNSAEKLKGDSLTMKFVGYVSPYLVVTNGGRYTKHIYAGSQRIASKLGDINAFGADPRRVAKAGHDVDNIEPIDFGTKYKNQNDAFKSRFDSLGSKFNGKTLDDYVNGQSFCCGDNSLDEIERNSDKPESAKKEDNLYFYHPDHLGSTSMVTNYDGEVTQNVAYIPYGEIFVEERNGNWATPFLFNAKELDEETGLYYYGARYYDPTAISWLSVDPMFEEEAGKSPYTYCAGNPIRYTDPTGMVKCDEDGNLIVHYDENEIEALRQQRSEYCKGKGIKTDVYDDLFYTTNGDLQLGVAYTSDNKPFFVWVNQVSENNDDNSNCAGHALLGGQAFTYTGIESDVILASEYNARDGAANAPNDIVVWRNTETGIPDHFSKILTAKYDFKSHLYKSSVATKSGLDPADIKHGEATTLSSALSRAINASSGGYNNATPKRKEEAYYHKSGSIPKNDNGRAWTYSYWKSKK